MSKMSVVALAATALLLPTASFAPPAAATPMPSAPTVTLVKTVLAKVDGDNKSDTVKLFSLGANVFKLQVTTNSGKTSSVQFTSVLPDGYKAPWYGAAPLDGVKGRELMVNLWSTPEALPTWGVYTWRKGKLVAERAPQAPKSGGGTIAKWIFEDHSAAVLGHRFYTSRKHRYVEASRLVASNSGKSWSGKIVRSIWRSGKWVKTSTRTVKLSTKSANRYLGLSGVDLLLGNLRSDIDGDGRNDRVDFFRYSQYKDGYPWPYNGVKVMTAAGKTVTKKLWDVATIYGAGTIDGVAGKELAFRTSDEQTGWYVLTWRSGKLVNAAAPWLCDRSGKWGGCSDESTFGLTFSNSGGTYSALGASYDEMNDPANIWLWQSEWRNNAWVLVSKTYRPWTSADAALIPGIHAPDMVSP